MSVYLISYDLKNHAQSYNYKAVHDKIKSFGTAMHILESTFLVDTSMTAQYMSDSLRQVYQPENHFIVKLQKGDYQGFINKTYWPWIQSKL